MSNQMDETLRRHVQSPLRTGRSQGGTLTTGQNQQVSMQVELGVAEVVTVTVDNTSLGGMPITAFATAQVEFTIDGTSIVRQFDVAAGASISGVAKAIRVSVKDSTPSAHPQNKSYGVTMSVAVMPRPTTAVPPVLTGLAAATVANGGGQETVSVPPGANSVVVYAYSSAALLLLLAEETADGVTVVLETLVTPGQFIPLVAGAGKIVLTNNGLASAQVTVTFGIDG
jgi:hypothetical protein